MLQHARQLHRYTALPIPRSIPQSVPAQQSDNKQSADSACKARGPKTSLITISPLSPPDLNSSIIRRLSPLLPPLPIPFAPRARGRVDDSFVALAPSAAPAVISGMSPSCRVWVGWNTAISTNAAPSPPGRPPQHPATLHTPSHPQLTPSSARTHTAATSRFFPATRNVLSTLRKLLESCDSTSKSMWFVSCTASTNDTIRSTRPGCTTKPKQLSTVPTSTTYCEDRKGQKQNSSSGTQCSHTPGMHTGSQLSQHCWSTGTRLLGISSRSVLKTTFDTAKESVQIRIPSFNLHSGHPAHLGVY